MQIVVNTRLLIKNRLEGIGWFSFQTLKRITQKHPDVHFVFLFDRPYDNMFVFSDNVTPIILSPQARHPFLYYIWFQFSVKSVLKRLKPDLFLSPDGFISLGAPCKQLAVIHDINFHHHPKDVKWLTSKYYNFFFPKFAKAATRLATVSEYSKQDISKHYHIPSKQIDVVYNGINEFFKPIDEALQIETRKKFAGGCAYFVYVGSIHPRKNIKTLVSAFAIFKKEHLNNVKLLLAGPAYWGLSELYQHIKKEGVEGDVIFTNRLKNEDLALVLGSAIGMTFIPYYEGFGIPLIEAMQAEIPIITSDVTSLPEIAGDAALLVNPKNTKEIKTAMYKLWSDENLRSDLVRKGRIQREKFSWDKSADLLWQSIEKALYS